MLIRFAACAPEPSARAAVAELCEALARISPVSLEVCVFDDYDALSEAFDAGACEAAWTPPLVAHALLRTGIAQPVVALGRRGATKYFAAFAVLEDSPVESIEDLAGTRVGWVSKLSASGYVFPRVFLRAQGHDPAALFASEAYYGSHDALGEALLRDEVDVVATHATVNRVSQELEPAELGVPVRIVASTGPIPGDLIVASSAMAAEARRDFGRALLAIDVPPDGAIARLMNVSRFEPVPHDHFALLDRWLGRPAPQPARGA